MIKMNIIKYAFENSTQLNSTQLILYKKLFLGITISFSNDLLKYIQYFIHKLISLISVIFNAYYKKFNYKEFNMNNTKTIFKSLLIMIVAISLFTVSCSKDEGGTKTPTNPTIVKVSADNITQTLKGLGQLKDTDGHTVILDFTSINPQNGSATIANANQSFGKVKTALTTVFAAPQTILTVTTDLKDKPKPNNQEKLTVNIEFQANSGFEFDTTITKPDASAKQYTYEESTKKAKLQLGITPKGNWTE